LQLNGYEKSNRALHVATLPCETLMSAKQAINDKLHGGVGTYLRCDRVVNKQTKKCLLLSVSEKIFLNRRILGKVTTYKQDRGSLMHFAHLANILLYKT